MTSKTRDKFSPEIRTRAVRMVLDHAGEHLALGGGDIDSREDQLHALDAA